MKRKFLGYAMVAAALAAGTGLTSLLPLSAQTTAAPAGATKTATPRTRSRTEKATIAAVTANSVQVTTKGGTLEVGRGAQTEYWRQEDNLAPSELRVGDTVAFTLRGTDGQPTVASLTPLSLKFGDSATLTFTNTNKMTFDRLTRIQAADLATGQNVSVAMNVLPDGKLEARKVTVIIAKPKTTRTPRAG